MSAHNILPLVICCLFAACILPTVNEKERIKASKSAFSKQRFREEPFRKSQIIARYADFLMRNSDTLLAYNQHNEFRELQLSEGRFSGYTKKPGECFTFIDTSQNFMNRYVPPFLMDSIHYYNEQVGSNLISSFTLCPGTHYSVIRGSTGNIAFHLKYKKDNINEYRYSLQHLIYANKKEPVNLDIQSMYDVLQKDTILIGELKYAIRVVPDTGL